MSDDTKGTLQSAHVDAVNAIAKDVMSEYSVEPNAAWSRLVSRLYYTVCDAEAAGAAAEQARIIAYARKLAELPEYAEEAGIEQLIVDVAWHDLHLDATKADEMFARLHQGAGAAAERARIAVYLRLNSDCNPVMLARYIEAGEHLGPGA